jgi:hypothetical protein
VRLRGFGESGWRSRSCTAGGRIFPISRAPNRYGTAQRANLGAGPSGKENRVKLREHPDVVDHHVAPDRIPTLVNVAVSRARRRIYVIGDQAAWSTCRYFDTLAAQLRGASGTAYPTQESASTATPDHAEAGDLCAPVRVTRQAADVRFCLM